LAAGVYDIGPGILGRQRREHLYADASDRAARGCSRRLLARYDQPKLLTGMKLDGFRQYRDIDRNDLAGGNRIGSPE